MGSQLTYAEKGSGENQGEKDFNILGYRHTKLLIALGHNSWFQTVANYQRQKKWSSRSTMGIQTDEGESDTTAADYESSSS